MEGTMNIIERNEQAEYEKNVFNDNRLCYNPSKNFIKVLQEKPLWGVPKKYSDDIFKDGQNFCENNNLPILCLSHGKKASSSTTFYKKMKK
jgi:hypothetical protein